MTRLVQDSLGSLRDTLHALNEGGPTAVKGAAAGLAMLGSAIWGALTSLLAAVLGFFWLLDMLSGMILAWEGKGGREWSWPKFWGGFRKLAIAGVAIGLGVGVDAVIASTGAQVEMFGIGAMGALIAAFGGSAAQNIREYFPGAGGILGKAMERIPGAEPSPTLDDVQRAAEVRRGNPPTPRMGRMNGTDN
jgi:hypothetical protein